MFPKIWVGLFLFSSFFFPTSEVRAARALKFKTDIIPLTAAAKRTFDLDLRTLLSDAGTGTLTWTIGNDKPAWLTLDSNNHRLFGMPALSDAKLHNFFLNVQDGESGARARVDLTVQIVPEWAQNPLDLGVQKERQKFTFDLKTRVTNPGPGSLTFSVGSRRGSRRLPAWMTLTPDGVLSGTPQRPDVGPYQDLVFVAKTESGGTASVSAFGRVEKDPLPPRWLNNPLIISNANEDFPYSFDVSGPTFVSNPEGTALAFRIVSGAPPWLQMTSAGNLFGTPGKAHVGAVKFRAEVVTLIAGRAALRDETEIQFQVIHTNHRPQWKNDPVVLPNAPSKIAYIQDLAQFVTDVDGDPLTFKLVPASGPAWASVNPKGAFTGTPQNSNIGANQWLAEVSDGEFNVQVTVRVTVTNAPPFWLTKPTVLPNAKEGAPYSQDISKLAKDPENDPLTFTLISGPSWISITPGGMLSGIPFAEHVGANTAKVRVSDGIGGADETDIQIKVDDVNFAPVIKAGITFTLKERETLTESLNQAKYVEDPDKDKLTFSLLDNVPWVLLAADGVLTLKPGHSQIGTHTVRFRVTDGALNTDGSMKIVVVRDPRPPVWLETPIRFTTKAREIFSTNIANKVQDPDGLPITFSKKSGPAWLSVGGNGQLSGTPADGDVGEGTFIINAKNDVLGTDGTVIITVVANNHAPFWIQDPITLMRGTAGIAYRDTVQPFARDVDPGDTLTFSKESGPIWVQVAANGDITGNPANGDIGLNSLRVKVTDSGGLSATVVVNITIDKGNAAPFWLTNPITLPDATQDLAFSFNLAPLAKDPDNDPITFRKISGPTWLMVAVNGAISGTPRAGDIGTYSAVFEVSDGKLTAQANATGKVLTGNRPPVVNQAALTFTVKERQTLNVNLNQPQYVSDPDGDALTFTLLDSLPWVTLSAAGQLSMSPLNQHIGDYSLRLRVSDGKLNTDGIINIKVIRDPRPPVWIVDPVRFDAKTKVAFSNTLADKVRDPDNLPLTFTKKSGPAWLSVAANGQISGTPQESDLGVNNFVVTASNGFASADGQVIITVTTSNSPPVANQQNLNFTVKENQTLTVNLNQPLYVSDPDGDALTFTLIDTAPWVTLSSTGTVIFKPLSPQVGDHAFKFNVTDGKSAPVVATLNVKVLKDPKPPVWIEDPIRFTAPVGQLFTASIADKVKDLNNLPLTFTKKSGPAWLTVSSNGSLSGTPQTPNLGENTFVITASNGTGLTDGTVIITVIPSANKPPIWVQDPITLPNANVGVSYSQSIAQFAMDPDGDAITFSKVSGPGWVLVATDGKVFGLPAKTDVGPVVLRVRVTDAKGASNDATVNFTVVDNTNRPPKWVRDPIPFGTQTVGTAFSLDLKPLAFDQDGDALTFRKVSGPGWIQISSAGLVTGTPQAADVGEYTGTIAVTDGKSPEVQAAYFGKVENGVTPNKPPKWVRDPIPFGTQTVGTAFSLDIKQFAFDQDGDALTFRKVSGPGWIQISAAGLVTGTPQAADLGDYTGTVAVTDGKSPEVLAGYFGKVEKAVTPNTPPKWVRDPIPFGTQTVGTAFSLDIKQFAFDQEGDALTFRKVSGPGWIQISAAGLVTGTPQAADLGEYTGTVAVTDGKSPEVLAGYFGKVQEGGPANRPPKLKPEALSFIVKANEIFQLNINKPQYVEDPDGDPLTFQLLVGDTWVTLTPAGDLTLKPLVEHIGDHTYRVKVSDNKGASDEGPMFVRVINNGTGPLWIQDPIRMTATVSKPFNNTLADKANDPAGLPLTFSKVSGPAWLTVAGTGPLSGTPPVIGTDTFRVRVQNTAGQFAEATLIITVKNDTPITDRTEVDKFKAGAIAENLWVVDNSWPWVGFNALVRALKEDVHVYFEELDKAQIHHTGIFLSSDVYGYNGDPIQGNDTSPFISWTDRNIVSHFISRIDATYSKKCYTSPIWSMFKFYQKAPTLSSIYHNGYFTEGMPMDAMVITKHVDYYQTYAKGTPQQSWTPDDYATNFINFHNQEKQNYRISAIAPECQVMLDPYEEDIKQTSASNPYRTLVKRTKGQYFSYDCNFDMAKVMKAYAQQVIFRARVGANRIIPLSETPSSPSTIEVFVAGKKLTPEQWSYDSIKNAVTIYWEKMDISTLKPGDLIEVKYRV